MSEQNHFMASDEVVGQNHKPNYKELEQISFRVSESEYLELKQPAEILNMNVSALAKKKVQGNRLVALKFDKRMGQSIAEDLGRLGANTNQVAKYCHQHRYNTPNYSALERNINELREGLDGTWQQLD